MGGQALLVGLLPRGGLGLQLGLGLTQPRQPVGLARKLRRQLVAAGVPEQSILTLVDLGGLAQDLGDLFFELVVGAVGLVGGVGGQLGAVQRDGADLDHPGGGAQLQRRHQEAGQGLLVASAEPRDGHMIRGLVGGQHPEGDVLSAAAFELPGGAHPDGVGVQQHAQQQLGVVGGVAVPVGAVRPVEGSQVELVDHVEDEPGQVAFGEPVAQVGWEQEGLVAVAAQEVVCHRLFYFALFAPNTLTRPRLLLKASMSRAATVQRCCWSRLTTTTWLPLASDSAACTPSSRETTTAENASPAEVPAQGWATISRTITAYRTRPSTVTQ
jgi:hypothetical protein